MNKSPSGTSLQRSEQQSDAISSYKASDFLLDKYGHQIESAIDIAALKRERDQIEKEIKRKGLRFGEDKKYDELLIKQKEKDDLILMEQERVR